MSNERFAGVDEIARKEVVEECLMSKRPAGIGLKKNAFTREPNSGGMKRIAPQLSENVTGIEVLWR